MGPATPALAMSGSVMLAATRLPPSRASTRKCRSPVVLSEANVWIRSLYVVARSRAIAIGGPSW
jgi:hypothetical protein